MSLQPALYKPHPPDRPRHILPPNMLRHLVLFVFVALCISFAVAATIEVAKPAVNIEPLKDEAKEKSDELEAAASGWGGYSSGWGGNNYYGRGWGNNGWNSGWGGRGYGGGWNNRGWGWGGRGYNDGWNGYYSSGYWG